MSGVRHQLGDRRQATGAVCTMVRLRLLRVRPTRRVVVESEVSIVAFEGTPSFLVVFIH